MVGRAPASAAPEELLPTQPCGDAGAGPSNAPPANPPSGGVNEDDFATVLSKQLQRQLLRQQKAELQAELLAQQQRPQQRGGPESPRANQPRQQHHHQQQRQRQQTQQQQPVDGARARTQPGARPQGSRPRRPRLSPAFPQAYTRPGGAVGQGGLLAVATPQLRVILPCSGDTVDAVEATINSMTTYMAELGFCMAAEPSVTGRLAQSLGLTVAYGMVSPTQDSFESVYNSPVLGAVVDPITAGLRLQGAVVEGATLRFDHHPLRAFELKLGSPMTEQQVMRLLVDARFLVVSALPVHPVFLGSEQTAIIWRLVVAWSGTNAPSPIKGEGDRVVGVFSFPT